MVAAKFTKNEEFRNFIDTNLSLPLNVFRPLTQSNDRTLSSEDMMYLEHHHRDMRTLGRAFHWRHGYPINLNCVFRRFGFRIEAKSYRYAALLHGCFRVHRTPTPQVLYYLDLFYKHTREAIESRNFVELVFACHMAGLYCFLTQQYSELIKHSLGLLLSFENVMHSRSIDVDEIFLMRCMIVSSFELIFLEMESRRWDDDWVTVLTLALKFARSASFLVQPQNRLRNGSEEIQDDDLKVIAKVLMFSLQIHLDYYSVITKQDASVAIDEINSVLGAIEDLLCEIVTMVPQCVKRFYKTLSYLDQVNRGVFLGTNSFYIRPVDSALMFYYFSAIILRNLVFTRGRFAPNKVETMDAVGQICRLADAMIARIREGPTFNPWPAISSLFVAEFASTALAFDSGKYPHSFFRL